MKKLVLNRRKYRATAEAAAVIESLEDRRLFCYGNPSTFAVPVPTTPVSTLVVDIEPITAFCSRYSVSVTTTANGGTPVVTDLTYVPSEFTVDSPQVPGLHNIQATIGNLNSTLSVTAPDSSSDTVSVLTNGANVIVNGGNDASNTITVSAPASSQWCNSNDASVQVNGGQNGFNQIILTGGSDTVLGGTDATDTVTANVSSLAFTGGDNGANSVVLTGDSQYTLSGGDDASNMFTITGGSGCATGGNNASNIVVANNTDLQFTGGTNGSNIVTVGTGQYQLSGATGSLNEFNLGAGCNLVVGATNAANIYNVGNGGSGVIIFGASNSATTNTVVSQSSSLNDYYIISNPASFCFGNGYQNCFGDDCFGSGCFDTWW